MDLLVRKKRERKNQKGKDEMSAFESYKT